MHKVFIFHCIKIIMEIVKVYSGKWGHTSKEGIVGRSRKLRSLEDELIRCEGVFLDEFKKAFVVMPGIQGKKIIYRGLLFDADESNADKLKEFARKINSQNTLPGKINIYKPNLSDNYYIFEMKPHHVSNGKDLRESTRVIANYVANFLGNYYRY